MGSCMLKKRVSSAEGRAEDSSEDEGKATYQDKIQREQKRREKLVHLRKYEIQGFLDRLGTVDSDVGSLGCVSVPEPWKYFGNDEAHAPRTLFKSFRQNSSEIEDALDGKIFKSKGKHCIEYSYVRSLVLALKVVKEIPQGRRASVVLKRGTVISVCVAVVRETRAGRVFEITWMAVGKKYRNCGYGSLMFEYVQRLAFMKGVRALGVAATTASMWFWIGLKPLQSGRLEQDIASGRGLDQILKDAHDYEEFQKSRLREMVAKRQIQFSGNTMIKQALSKYYDSSGTVVVRRGGSPPMRRSCASAPHIWYILPVAENSTRAPASAWQQKSSRDFEKGNSYSVPSTDESLTSKARGNAKMRRQESRRERNSRRSARRESSRQKMRTKEKAEAGSLRSGKCKEEQRKRAREVRWVYANEVQ